MDTEPLPLPAPALPDDAVATILRLLPARSLAASRCVCKAWRALVDGHRLLARHLLPHSVRGLFINYANIHLGGQAARPRFLARPTPGAAARRIDGEFDYVPRKRPDGNWYSVGDHCNGLVLYRDEVADGRYLDEGYDRLHVCNPMARRSARLPLLRVHHMWRRRAFLVFDAAVSQHYEVFLEPAAMEDGGAGGGAGGGEAGVLMERRWPPSLWAWHAFSSRTGRWQERVFAREGEAAGILSELRMDSLRRVPQARWRYAVYWQGALYVHCHGEYISRLSLSVDTYRVIKSPIDRSECYNDVQSFLGRSEKGVYFAAIHGCRLRVWILSELHDRRTEWIPKHDSLVKPVEWWKVVSICNYHHRRCHGPWILDDYHDNNAEEKRNYNNSEWSSDDDDLIDPAAGSNIEDWFVMHDHPFRQDRHPECFTFLGFHPYKEVIFLSTVNVGVAYHLDSSKVQFLGILNPWDRYDGVYDSFVYTPCIRPA